MTAAREVGLVIAVVYFSVQLLITLVTSFFSLQAVREANVTVKHLDLFLGISTTATVEASHNGLSCTKMFQIWSVTMWKMRSIYSALTVHIFDVITDILVIAEWWDLEKNDDIDNVDTRQLAITAIGILCLHKIVSSVAILVATDWSVVRAILQFFDLLLFEEILIAHRQVVTFLTDAAHSAASGNVGASSVDDYVNNVAKLKIESTMRFKYIRSLESLFESTPQAVLQTVYMMRTGGFVGDYIVIISTLQSIISMTSSMVSADNAYMQTEELKPFKKKCPPSLPFLRHGLVRLCEITYRVGLLSLFWTVVSGQAFVALLAVEIVLLTSFLAFEFGLQKWTDTPFTGIALDSNTVFLLLNQLIVLPPEFILFNIPNEYLARAAKTVGPMSAIYCVQWFFCVPCGFVWLMCGMIVPIIWFHLCGLSVDDSNLKEDTVLVFPISCARLGMSLIEWIIVIVVGVIEIDSDRDFLFSQDHCLYFLIVSLAAFVFYTSFPLLMPDITLPHNIPIRSKLGYAYLGELSELERMNVPVKWTSDIGGFWDLIVGEEQRMTLSEYITQWNEHHPDDLEFVQSLINYLNRDAYTLKVLDRMSKEEIDSQVVIPFVEFIQSNLISQVCQEYSSRVLDSLLPPEETFDIAAVDEERVLTAAAWPEPLILSMNKIGVRATREEASLILDFILDDDSTAAPLILFPLLEISRKEATRLQSEEGQVKEKSEFDVLRRRLRRSLVEMEVVSNKMGDLSDILHQRISEYLTKKQTEGTSVALLDRISSLREKVSKVLVRTKDVNYDSHRCCAVYALMNRQYQAVKWLESKGAKKHIALYENRAKRHQNLAMDWQWAEAALMEEPDDLK